MKKRLIIIRIFLINLLWITACMCQSIAAGAQQHGKQEAIKELNLLMSKYRASDHLSFDIGYRYSTEDKPGAFLDSLKGKFKMHGASYWYSIDSTEAVVGKDFSLMLFKEDKIIYLGKPSAGMPDKNPLSMPDTAYLNSDAVQCTVAELDREKKITLEFKPGSGCKRIEYYISKKTGYISRVLSYVQSRELYDASVKPVVEGSSYAIVEMRFGNYKEKSFSDTDLDPSKYVRKEGNEYVAASQYESYKIFLGNPNL